MNIPLAMGSALIMGLLLAPVARAEPPTNVKIEVNFLLGYVDGSRCEFYRNGTWHDSKAAQAHLRLKYNYLALRNMINTTDEFILRAATKSSLSGKPYMVRCHGGAIVTSNKWLSDELARFRKY
ncbi:MAG: YfeK family protein [Sulfuricaulis sp.]